MAEQHQPLRASPTIERRPPAHIVQRSAATSTSPAATPRAQASQPTLSTAARPGQRAVSVSVTSPVSIQTARVSQPSDPAELEATRTARKIVQMGEPAKAPAKAPAIRPEEQSKKKQVVQRAAREAQPAVKPDEDARKTPIQRAARPAAPPVLTTAISPAGGGAPLPASVRSFMEPRFGANFGNVRIHTGNAAAEQSASLNAHAFTVGQHVFFGRNQFQPESSSGRELIAHELTHTIQQGAAVQRSAAPDISERSEPQIQRFGLSDALDYIADKANYIPGFRLLTIVLGINPINMAPVERSTANILRGMLELISITGALIAQALDQYGILAKVAAWAEGHIRSLGMVGGALKQALTKFLDSLGWSDILSPGDVWERGKRIFTEPIDRLISFGKTLVGDILGFIREAVLMPLAKLAEGTRGYDLLKAVLGQDPVTGEKVAPTAEAFVGGFLKLIGQEDIWENIQKAKALPRIWAWFQGAMASLKGVVSQIPALFIAALKALDISDLVLPFKAFGKLVNVFGSFVGQFVSWGLGAAWTLLEIVFDVVSPGALVYVKKTGAALKGILKNPLPFVGNLVKAAKLGFTDFAGNFLTHLKAGLIDWLTGSLPGIYIPKAFSLVEIAKFAFSVLGLTWANIRAKLVTAVGGPVVKALETGFDIVVKLVREGPAAAWDLIKEQLANLKDMVIGGITDFVVDTVVKKAIPKLISMFIPGAGFISAILSIYDTVMVFVNKISQIIQVVKSFIDSIVAIAAGQIAPAAQRVEGILANLLSLAINFLAGFAGLGKVADKIMGVINKIRAPIDKALDWLIGWIVGMAKKLGKGIVQAGVPKDPLKRLDLAASAATAAAKRLGNGFTKPLLIPILASIKARYGLASIDVFERGGSWWVSAAINPKLERNMGIITVGTPAAAAASTLTPMKQVSIDFKCNTGKYILSVYSQQLKGQEDGLNVISVKDWKDNRKSYDASGRGSSVPQEEVRELYRKDLKSRNMTPTEIEFQLARLAALHEPDLVAGGFNTIAKLGSRYINSSIGSQWKTKVEDIETGVKAIDKKDWPKQRINVKLQAVAFTEA
ncbi:DUF4157 domain-containing protein [Rhizobium sp. WYJ-E13]|uniref:eCIS core domain-containing protein n=1 Tax=Rhizobium sp. WYJ-E13 TaxID=2849093 RepID=UPI001C1F01F9|nr:DUF4157 domain-containing protein [Rhizobium sp. WYJ-E13]QWW71203.1 DUF4157 domain-containing protein [Rhizobium sp. WYJ-E13]